MMRPLTLEEFAKQLRAEGNEFADEILDLIALEDEVAEPYSELCGDLEHYAPDNLKSNHAKAVEWLGDRSHLLTEIEDKLEKAGRTGDVDDMLGEVLDELKNVETIMENHGGWVEGDLQDALFALIERATSTPLEFDL